jgi:hypothetical protein
VLPFPFTSESTSESQTLTRWLLLSNLDFVEAVLPNEPRRLLPFPYNQSYNNLRRSPVWPELCFMFSPYKWRLVRRGEEEKRILVPGRGRSSQFSPSHLLKTRGLDCAGWAVTSAPRLGMGRLASTRIRNYRLQALGAEPRHEQLAVTFVGSVGSRDKVSVMDIHLGNSACCWCPYAPTWRTNREGLKMSAIISDANFGHGITLIWYSACGAPVSTPACPVSGSGGGDALAPL